MKRIASYRSGDRAETFGATLLQSFCAVAPVPRPEDFGLVDAVATLLRRDGRFLYADDSFLIQFKSRTEKRVEFLGDRFQALLRQELPFFIGHVDLATGTIALHNVGVALTHPNVLDMRGLVLHLDRTKPCEQAGVLHAGPAEPALRFTVAQLADDSFQATAYSVLKAWLEWDRWNRRNRPLGIQMQITWKTNEVPIPNGTSMLWNPSRAEQALSEAVPAVQLIAGRAVSDTALAAPILEIIAWMREQGVDPDPAATFGLTILMKNGQNHLQRAMSKCPDAEIAVQLLVTNRTADSVTVWEQGAARNGSGCSAAAHTGTARQLRKLGFKVQTAHRGHSITTVAIGEAWLKAHGCSIVAVDQGVWLLRKR